MYVKNKMHAMLKRNLGWGINISNPALGENRSDWPKYKQYIVTNLFELIFENNNLII